MLLKNEKRSTFAISLIYAFRMLGLFIILPVFSLYADKIIDATPTLIGVALGIYGLTQALLQIVLGVMSDRYGRKPIIVFGLLIFILGSIIAALSHNIYGIIIGRALQGAGAIGSTLTALVADVTKEENRMKAMSVIGMSIGLSFVAALVMAPMINAIIGLSGIFWLTAVLGGVGIIVLIFWVPTPTKLIFHKGSETTPRQIKKVLIQPELMRLNVGIFALHAMLTSLFLVMPVILIDYIGIMPRHQWVIYLPVMIISFLLMVPFIIIAETKHAMKPVFLVAIGLLLVTQFMLHEFDRHIVVMSLLLILFFASFTFLEAALPSLISKLSPISSKGTAMGVYSSFQFFGIFIGGALGGVILHQFAMTGVFVFNMALALIWLLLALGMKKPKQLSTKIYALQKGNQVQKEQLKLQILALKGVEDVMLCFKEGAVYLKVDKKRFDETQLKQLL